MILLDVNYYIYKKNVKPFKFKSDNIGAEFSEAVGRINTINISKNMMMGPMLAPKEGEEAKEDSKPFALDITISVFANKQSKEDGKQEVGNISKRILVSEKDVASIFTFAEKMVGDL